MVSRRSRSLVLPPLEDWVGETPTTILSATCRGSEKAVRPSHMANSLFQAVQNTRFKRVQVLLDQGLRLRQLRNEARENVLMVSLKAEDEARREKMFSYLIKRGADPTYVHPSSGRDVLIWAVCRSCPRQVTLVFHCGDYIMCSQKPSNFELYTILIILYRNATHSYRKGPDFIALKNIPNVPFSYISMKN